MTHTNITIRRKLAGWDSGRTLPVFIGILLAFSLGACDSKRVLEVTDPDVAKTPDLAGNASIPVVYAGAVGDFAVAFGGNTSNEGEVGYSALITDEYLNAETFPTRIEIDQRNTTADNANIVAVFRATQRARASADFASTKISLANPNDVRRSETMSLAGFAIDLMGEDYCSGVPLSRLTENTELIFGDPQTTAQLWDGAISKFDSAITIATANGTSGVPQLNLARIGKGRALVNKGDYAGAAAVVAPVPTNFVYLVLHSLNTSRENNGVFFWNLFNKRFSATDKEGINGLPYRSDADPRTAQKLSGVGFDGFTPFWLVNAPANAWAPQGKYPVRDASVPLATGLEARLIEAEAAMAANNPVTYLAAINAEQTAQSPPPPAPGVTLTTTVPATPAAQQDQLFKERAYSLWFTGHRLGDMRRLIRQYGRNSETVFPTGPFFHSGSASGNYGTDVNIILPNAEKNNPSFKGCIDRNA